MRHYGLRKEIRLSASDTAWLARLAERAGRPESEVVRILIRSVDPDQVSTGIPPLTLRTEAPSGPGPATTEAQPRREAVLA